MKIDEMGRHQLKRAVLLINLGTPQGPDVPSVRRYLREFLSDPTVIQLPRGLGWLNGVVGTTVALFRAPSSAKMYQSIWTDQGSPLLTITEAQRSALESLLSSEWRVFMAMRYGKPTIAATLGEIEKAGIHELVVIPMYPHYSKPSTGTALNLLYDHLSRTSSTLAVTVRTSWHDDSGYVNAQADLISEYAASHGLDCANTYLLFSAHGLPESYITRGDPYQRETCRSVSLISERLGWPSDRYSLAYQSRLGPVQWLTPFTDHVIPELANTSQSSILICPISFTADCLETLEEINLRYRAIAESVGVRLYLCPALNTYAPFIAALKKLVLHGPRVARSAPDTNDFNTPSDTITLPAQTNVENWVMVGVSMRGRIHGDDGPAMRYADRDQLRRFKRSQTELPKILQRIKEKTGIHDAWVWNTCHRFEYYGWLNQDCNDAERQGIIECIHLELFGDVTNGDMNINVLSGDDVWHHILRTAAGLNSSLPGETDVLEQLQAACRLSAYAECAGYRTRQLVSHTKILVEKLRRSTAWQSHESSYPHAALKAIIDQGDLAITTKRIVVFGGSTTSAGVLRTLRDRFGVPAEQLCLFYRGHKNGHVKRLREAIGSGRRVRVQSYDQRCVVDALRNADVLVFGVDRHDPVLTYQQLDGLRNWREHPLTIFDFNMFGSTKGLETIEGVILHSAALLEGEVDRFADACNDSTSFAEAVLEAEEWLVRNAMDGTQRMQPAGQSTPCSAEECEVDVKGTDTDATRQAMEEWVALKPSNEDRKNTETRTS